MMNFALGFKTFIEHIFKGISPLSYCNSPVEPWHNVI